MKLELGMYCYDKTNRKYGIGKIIEIRQRNNYVIECKNGIVLVSCGNLVASHNIIDLIEVGDYVNGDIVIGISDIKFKGILFKGIIFKDAKYIYYPKKTKSKYLNEFDKLLSDGKIDFFEEFKTPDYLIEQGMYKHFFIPLEDNIKTILTKEQFENNCFTIEDN